VEGHGVAGHAVNNGGIMIDLTPMKSALPLPAAGVGGALWGEFDHETQAFGLATTGGVVTYPGVATDSRRRNRPAHAQKRDHG
jgi:hypothetical protein